MSHIEIDGSFGEGGGQILRTSLSLSLVTGKAFRIDRIRAGREKPGLLRQHLTAVRAAAAISGAQVEGAEPGSKSLSFVPGAVRPGDYHFAVGTAGSATLVLQTVLPPLMLAAGPSALTLEGGTHNSAAPPFDFLERSFVPLLVRMGPRVRLAFERYGFYPAGGGLFRAVIEPCAKLVPLHLGPRGAILERRIAAVAVNLPSHIVHRERETAARLLGWGPETFVRSARCESPGAGNVVMIEVKSEEVTEIFTSFGQRGVSAEDVATAAASETLDYLDNDAATGEHLADQLLLPLALAGAGSFTASRWNLHAQTNAEVIARFLPVRFEVKREASGTVRVQIS